MKKKTKRAHRAMVIKVGNKEAAWPAGSKQKRTPANTSRQVKGHGRLKEAQWYTSKKTGKKERKTRGHTWVSKSLGTGGRYT